MPVLQVDCPGCGRALRVPAHYAGAPGNCKHCGATFTVPSAAHALVGAAAGSVAQLTAQPAPGVPPEEARRGGRIARIRDAMRSGKPRGHGGIKATPLAALLAWLDALPRSTPSLREQDARRSKPLFLTADDVARSKAYFDVPLLLALKHEALVIVKTTQANITPGTAHALSSGAVSLEATYFRATEYPIIRLLFTIQDNPGKPLKFEALPLLTDGNSLEFFATALRTRCISFMLFAGSQSSHVATAEMPLDVDLMCDLGNSLVRAIRQWRKTQPDPAAHDPAMKRFVREVPL